MNLNDLANIGQVIGAIAVVISLIYVALQIRQNTNAVRSATAQSVHEHFANWYHLIAADLTLSDRGHRIARLSSLSEAERTRFIATFMAFLSYSQNAFLKWREGLLAPPLWRVGSCDDESFRCAGWQRLLERARISVWRRIPPDIEDDLMKRTRTPTRNQSALSASAKRFLPADHTKHAKSGYHSSEIRRQK